MTRNTLILWPWLCLLALCFCPALFARTESGIGQLVDSIRLRYAPDGRTELFQVRVAVEGDTVRLGGVTTSAQAHDELLRLLCLRGWHPVDGLRLLPDTAALEGRTWGVVRLSVCNLHSRPDHSSEMLTQALLGMPVRVLQRDDWYRVQTPDGYIAWVHRAGVQPMTAQELSAWNRADKLVVTALFGLVYSLPDAGAQPVSDVVSGNRLELLGTAGGFYHVRYPDGRTGYLPLSAARPEAQWRQALVQDVPSILRTAHMLMGIPSLWAGTSAKGMDCSGFVRTVLLMHDIIIPRDASQQAYVGQRVDVASGFAGVQPGDLLFFGTPARDGRRERIVHVAIYLGGLRFIHAQGDVRLGSFDPADPLYDDFNLRRLLFAVRVLPFVGRLPQLNTTATNSFYAPVPAPLPW